MATLVSTAGSGMDSQRTVGAPRERSSKIWKFTTKGWKIFHYLIKQINHKNSKLNK